MADAVDFANDEAEYFLQLSLQRLARLPDKPSAEICVDCDEPIPAARQLSVVGCETCVDCQDLRERRR
ncbi:TraR/DksA C4-type zinc finger protein [Pseudomonas entomophila]|uniref:TraR/DksA C4-type zinc finger protein n=1 Tax=Pseudomonas entomophila TaxID=312306 RepID=UPI001F0201DF|nr:TraR/DksA C4-type zinc finger protein [Pseudomonas entomophila]MCG8292264.1 TraR/DksA C4-type zinc finger protein [Pseudomonas entomophila]